MTGRNHIFLLLYLKKDKSWLLDQTRRSCDESYLLFSQLAPFVTFTCHTSFSQLHHLDSKRVNGGRDTTNKGVKERKSKTVPSERD